MTTSFGALTHPDARRLRGLVNSTRPDPAGWLDERTLDAFADTYATTLCECLRRHVPKGATFTALTDDELAAILAEGFRNGFVLGVQFQAAGGHREP